MNGLSSRQRKSFQHTRLLIRDLVTMPVQTWLAFGESRKTAALYRTILDIPARLASAGFTVMLTRTGTGWTAENERQITDPAAVLPLQGDAHGCAAARLQMAHDADTAIIDLQHLAATGIAWPAREAAA